MARRPAKRTTESRSRGSGWGHRASTMPIRGDIWGAFTAREEEPMAHTALLNVTAKPGRGSEVISYYRATLSATRSRPGLIGLRVVRNMEDPNRFMLIEQWDSKADQAKIGRAH